MEDKLQDNMKMIRQALNLSAADASVLLGVSRQTIYNIESNKASLTGEQRQKFIDYIEKCCEQNQGLSDIINVMTE